MWTSLARHRPRPCRAAGTGPATAGTVGVRASTPAARLRAASAALLLALVLSGCAGFFSSRDVAPSGLSRRDDSLRLLMVSGRPDSALTRVAPTGPAAPEDELLRSLYAGILAHYAGRFTESGAALQRAADLAEERYTRRISREAISLISSDRVLPYEPDRTERLLIPFYGALNHLRLGRLDGAAVEVRRLAFLLERDPGGGSDPGRRQLLGFLRYFTGTVFEAAGESNDAGVAYRNAAMLLGADPFDPPSAALQELGEVIVVVEQEFVAHRIEQSLVVPLHPVEAARIRSGDAGDRLGTAALVAARVVGHALADADRSLYYDGPRPRAIHVPPPDARHFELECRDAEEGNGKKEKPAGCDEEGLPYIIRIAWPVLRNESRSSGGGRIVVGSDSIGAAMQIRASLSDAVAADFADERPLMLARTVARATSKLMLTRAVEKRAGDRDETVGQVLGAIANLGTALLEQADTRSWQLLPGQIGLARIRLPPGTHALALEIPADGRQAARRIELGEAEVAAGRPTFLTVRSWN